MVERMTGAEIFSNVATLVVLIVVVTIITIPKKTDSKSTTMMRKLARNCLTVSLACAVALAAVALYMAKAHK
jgi:hypothetical protein